MKFSRVLFLVYLFLLCFLTGCNNSNRPKLVSEELRNQALQELQLTLSTQSEWVKVHAAEYLLWLDYPEGVRKIFLEEQGRYGTDSPYRIGIWRVLAQTAEEPKKKKIWLNRIINAYQNTNGADRIHAAETLAKLKIAPSKVAPEANRKILKDENSILAICTIWGNGTSTSDSLNTERKALLEIISSDPDENVSGKKTAAYALRHLRGLTSNEWQLLAETALSEPNESEVRVYMLSAAFVTAPADSTQSKTCLEIRKNLLMAKDSPNKADRAEMIIALAERGTSKDLPILLSLLNGESQIIDSKANEDINVAANSDVRAAAAYAILRIDRKQEYSLAVGDWIVIIAYLSGMIGIGFYYSRQNKSEKDFLLGGGKMNPIAVGMSLFATLLSSLTYLSIPGEIIKYGPFILTGMLAFPLVYYVVGWFLIPKFMNMNVTSAYEILEKKLGISVRLMATFFFLSIRFLWMATIIYVTVEIAILSVFNIDPDNTLIISAILMVITIAYTSMGGLKAVVFTDVIQSVVLIGGALLSIIVVSVHFGSPTEWLPDEWFSHWSELKYGFDTQERVTVANVVLNVFIWQICAAGSDQMSIQRFLATEDVKSARKTFGVSLLTNFIAQSLLGLVGFALIAYFMANPQYLSEGSTLNEQADTVFPKFILVGFPIGISGLVAAGIFAAAMSSLSSGLNSSASVISEDLIKRFKFNRKNTNELKQVRLLSFIVGIFTLFLSIGVSYVEGNLLDIIIKVVNLFVAPLFVLFFLALFIPFATANGTFIGGIISVIVAITTAFFGFLGIGVLFIMPFSLFAGIIIGALYSFVDHKVFGNPETAFNRSKKESVAQEKKVV